MILFVVVPFDGVTTKKSYVSAGTRHTCDPEPFHATTILPRLRHIYRCKTRSLTVRRYWLLIYVVLVAAASVECYEWNFFYANANKAIEFDDISVVGPIWHTEWADKFFHKAPIEMCWPKIGLSFRASVQYEMRTPVHWPSDPIHWGLECVCVCVSAIVGKKRPIKIKFLSSVAINTRIANAA